MQALSLLLLFQSLDFSLKYLVTGMCFVARVISSLEHILIIRESVYNKNL